MKIHEIAMDGESQITLPLFRPRIQDHAEDRARLLWFLANRGWRTASDIKSVLGYDDRYTRKLASECEGKIIGSQDGYRLTMDATPEDMNEWRGRQQSQIEQMQKRIIMTEKAWHSRQNHLAS